MLPPSSFCLIEFYIANMKSQTRTIVKTMEYYEVEPMFALTVGLGLTAFMMAWEILVIALKAWAVKREIPTQRRSPYHHQYVA